MSAELGVALPFWLDRPDEEAVEIAVAAEQAGVRTPVAIPKSPSSRALPRMPPEPPCWPRFPTSPQ